MRERKRERLMCVKEISVRVTEISVRERKRERLVCVREISVRGRD